MPETPKPTQSPTNIVIVGGVAGGMSTATRLRRLDAGANIIVIERSGHVSFANCGLPYFVGGLIEEEEDLTLQTPQQLFDSFRLDVRVHDEVVAIDRAAHTVITRSTVTGEETAVSYDKLVLSMGAAPVRPPIPGYDRVRTLRTVEDAARLARDVDVAPATCRRDRGRVHRARDGGEPRRPGDRRHDRRGNARRCLPRSTPSLRFSCRDELVAHGVRVETGATVSSIGEHTVTLADGRVLAADLVVGAIGVRPDVGLAELAGLELGPSGGIAVNEANQTNDPDIYAVGDAVEKPDAVSHATSLIALANVANRQGRRVADHIAGRPSHRRRFAGDRHREGFRRRRGDRRMERAAPAGSRPAVPGNPFASLRPCDLLPGGDPHGREAHLRPGETGRSSVPRLSDAMASTRGST